MNKKALSIGIVDFKEIIEENYYYVDKSLLIKELLDGGTKATLIPRPRRFGKTINLSMLKYFFEKTEKSNAHLFKDLAIVQHTDCMAHQGQSPVIFLTFKDVKVGTWDKCWEKIKKLISFEYGRHEYILETSILSVKEKEDFASIINEKDNQSLYENSVLNLSVYLTRYHNKQTIILIDEYDAPIHAGYLNNYYSQVIEFMRNFLSAGLKDNSNLAFGVLTGILRIAKESIFSGLNNLEVCSMLSEHYADKFGLLEDEVKNLIAYYCPTVDINEVRAWYDGYNVGTKRIYNPWSVINFAKNKKFDPYWVNTSDNALIKSIIAQSPRDAKEDIESLIAGKKISVQINENIVFQDMEKDACAIWNFFLFTGYLTCDNVRTEELIKYADVAVPNNEVMSLYKTIILDWFSKSVGLRSYQQMLAKLTSGDIENFKEYFYDVIERSLSLFDVSGKEPERFYHALVLGMLVSLDLTHIIKSNRESGVGRYDVMIIPRDVSKFGIIIEFKKVSKIRKETLATAAQNALKQIDDRKYASELEQLGIKKILKLAIVFEGKEVLVEQGVE